MGSAAELVAGPDCTPCPLPSLAWGRGPWPSGPWAPAAGLRTRTPLHQQHRPSQEAWQASWQGTAMSPGARLAAPCQAQPCSQRPGEAGSSQAQAFPGQPRPRTSWCQGRHQTSCQGGQEPHGTGGGSHVCVVAHSLLQHPPGSQAGIRCGRVGADVSSTQPAATRDTACPVPGLEQARVPVPEGMLDPPHCTWDVPAPTGMNGTQRLAQPRGQASPEQTGGGVVGRAAGSCDCPGNRRNAPAAP